MANSAAEGDSRTHRCAIRCRYHAGRATCAGAQPRSAVGALGTVGGVWVPWAAAPTIADQADTTIGHLDVCSFL